VASSVRPLKTLQKSLPPFEFCFDLCKKRGGANVTKMALYAESLWVSLASKLKHERALSVREEVTEWFFYGIADTLLKKINMTSNANRIRGILFVSRQNWWYEAIITIITIIFIFILTKSVCNLRHTYVWLYYVII